MTFWKPDTRNSDTIICTELIQATEDELSEFHHVILSQPRVHDFYLEAMRNSNSALVSHYSWGLIDLAIVPYVKIVASLKFSRSAHPLNIPIRMVTDTLKL
ncbi:hypothetical protein AB833_20670 [Chromatiales bacterium (ex Bugula neritina AB1)]|nr:hypothetical protein AB833_20670 [Chromatiales bacterium (ex Bugula neritina AB1)]